jgi:hypothetical protein
MVKARHADEKERRGIHLIADWPTFQLEQLTAHFTDAAASKSPAKNSADCRAHRVQTWRPRCPWPTPARIGVCMPREIHFFYDELWVAFSTVQRVAQFGVQFVNRPVQVLEGDTEAFTELVEEVNGIF